MKKQSRTVPRRRQSVSPTPRHLPLVDILIDTQAELQALVVASGLKVLEAMLEEDRGRRLWATVCASTCAPGVSNGAYAESGRAGRAEGGDSSAPCAARRRGGSRHRSPRIDRSGLVIPPAGIACAPIWTAASKPVQKPRNGPNEKGKRMRSRLVTPAAR